MLLDKLPIKYRLTVGHTLLMGALFTGVGIGLYKIVESQLKESIDAALLASATSIRDARYQGGSGDRRVDAFFKHFFRNRMSLSEVIGEPVIRPYAQLINVSGQISSRSENLRVSLPVTPYAIGRSESGESTFETFSFKDGEQVRQITLPVFSDGRFTGDLVQVGTSLNATLATLRNTKLILWILLPVGLFVSCLVGFFLTSRALRPVVQITGAAGTMSIDELGNRLPLTPANDELRNLSVTFNAMFDRLEDAVSRLRRFTGDVSHELRTPLAVLRGEAELCLRKERSPDEYRAALQTIAQESIHMSSIVEDLLLLARAESRSVAMKWQKVPVKEFVLTLVNSVKPVFEQEGIQLDVSSLAGAEVIEISPTYLELALSNVLRNAAKHSPREGKVLFEVGKVGKSILFTVTDAGEGIPEDQLSRIFETFHRVDSARNRQLGGTGIGLSLAKALVKLHKGTIEVRSEVGKGSCFMVSLPTQAS